MLVVRGTKKLRDRVNGMPATADDASTSPLGDWFATALFWKPQVALLVNARTLVPVFLELAPAATLLDRIPHAIESILRQHGADDTFLDAEGAAMRDVRIAPTNDRSVVGVMNEFAFHGEWLHKEGLTDLVALSMRLAHMPLGPLRNRHGFPDRELAALIDGSGAIADVIPLHPNQNTPVLTTSPPAAGAVYELKVTLLGTKPPIWRRVLVDGASTLDQIHEVIQAAFGWWGYHLHEFEVGEACYGVPDPDHDWGPPMLDKRRARLDSVAGQGTKLTYTYDFGDDWRHRILVEKVLASDTNTTVPACTDGRRACPPEDCGGTWGYEELLGILADPTHPEHGERRDWIGHPFDPEAFDPSDFKANLRSQQLAGAGDWP